MSALFDIRVDGVTKIFHAGFRKRKVALNSVSFDISSGSVVGVLGPNGSGKSTLIKLMMGFLYPTLGEISLLGYSVHETQGRKLVGYVPENPRFQRFLTARKLLSYYGKLLDVEDLESRIEQLLDWVGLAPAANERIQGYSKGMVQRLAIAQALLNRPRLLIFDEPMSGLDPLGRSEIRNLMRQIHEEMPETTIFFSTHVLVDIEELCTLVLLLRSGSLVRLCSVSELIAKDRQTFELALASSSGLTQNQLGLRATLKETPLGPTVVTEGVEKLRAQGIRVHSVSSHRRALEEALFAANASGAEPSRIQEEVRP